MTPNRKLTLEDYGRAFMWLLAITVLALGLCACRSQPGDAMDKAIDGTQVALAGLDIAVDKGAKGHRAGLNAAVEICRATLGEGSTPEQRTACLHQYLLAPDDIEEFEEILRTTSVTYDQLVELLPLLVRLRDFIDAAQTAVDQRKEGS